MTWVSHGSLRSVVREELQVKDVRGAYNGFKFVCVCAKSSLFVRDLLYM